MKFTSSQNKLILETDAQIRDLERAAATGDPEAGATHQRELRRRMGADERIKSLERAAADGDPEARMEYRHELRRRMGLEKVDSVRCLGIYKGYGHGADSPNMFFVGNEELAETMIKLLDDDDGGIHTSEGGEWSAWWGSKSAVAELDDVLLTDAEILKTVEEIRDY